MYFYGFSNSKKPNFSSKEKQVIAELLPVIASGSYCKKSRSVVCFCPFLPAAYVNIQGPHVYTRIEFQGPQLGNGCLNHSVGEEKQTSHLSMFTSSNKEVLACP